MPDFLTQLYSYARSTWRFRWYAQLIAWPLCFIGWSVIYFLPNQYEASARVFVDTQSMLRPLLQGLAVQTNFTEQVQSMTRTLLSRPNIERVARMTDLDLQAKTPEEMESLLSKLSKKIVLTNIGNANIFSISYTHNDPQLAKKVVQSLLTLFMESSLGDTRKDTDAAQKFIDEQIREYESKLFAAEDKLKDFKRQNMSVMPSEGRGYYDRLQTETATLERAKLELREVENRRDELQRQLSGEEPSFGIMSQQTPRTASALSSAGEERVQILESKLDDLLLKYTDSHPDVTTLRKQIVELRAAEQKRQETLAAKQPAPAATLESNPVYQQFKISLGEAEANVAMLRVRVNEFQQRVAQLNTMVDTVPQVEAELARLNRDYSVNKQNYESLIARRATAQISESADQSSDNLKFKIVDPPRVPLSPAAPNRPLLSSAVLVLSIAAGIVVAFFISQLKPTFDNYRAVIASTNVPVLGHVSMVWTNAARTRYRIEVVSYIVISVALFCVYAAYMAMQLISHTAAR